jgi:hypothetical protein
MLPTFCWACRQFGRIVLKFQQMVPFSNNALLPVGLFEQGPLYTPPAWSILNYKTIIIVIMMANSTNNSTKNSASIDSRTTRPIPTTVNGHEIDALICKEMNQMSLQERERTFDEIHGVHPIIQETPDLIPLAVHQFQSALSRIAHKPAYQLAHQQSEAYVTSPQFALLFLRAASFDALEAAQKCVDYCQGKLDLFGMETLTRSVQLSDLNSDDLACLKSGAYQWLSTRDASGRCVMLDFHLIMPQCYKEPINLVRSSIRGDVCSLLRKKFLTLFMTVIRWHTTASSSRIPKLGGSRRRRKSKTRSNRNFVLYGEIQSQFESSTQSTNGANVGLDANEVARIAHLFES